MYSIKKRGFMDFILKYGNQLDNVFIVVGALLEIIVMFLIYIAYKNYKKKRRVIVFFKICFNP